MKPFTIEIRGAHRYLRYVRKFSSVINATTHALRIATPGERVFINGSIGGVR